jgi:molybdopterin converting factor subunit 1
VVKVVQVRLFARFRDAAGADTLECPFPEPPTVGGLRGRVGARFPELGALLARSAFAVNGEFADDDTPLSPGDEVAVIPPVSGG